jgi:heme/copper-type cytochrome/quinol oxidase subunit 2
MAMFNQLLSRFASGTCAYSKTTLFNFPTWYHYLPGTVDPATNTCVPSITSISDVWLIMAAVVEILLRVAALVAIVMVIYGAIEYTRSQGEPDKTSKARSTIINALAGLVISVLAAAIVTFVAGRFNAS